MSMIAEAFKPDATKYAEHKESEEELYYRQYCAALPLIDGALSILKESSDECSACGTAQDLLEAFQVAMEKASEAVNKVKRMPIPQITITQLREKLGKVGRADISIRVNSEGYVIEEIYRIVGEGKFPWELSKEDRAALASAGKGTEKKVRKAA